ncbi:MAG: ABC transporter ATP-binding protein [Solirubrobacterales bacterium]|nr:ABC transporter ATP-binding protein [Solirubrobacterales bacterium]
MTNRVIEHPAPAPPAAAEEVTGLAADPEARARGLAVAAVAKRFGDRTIIQDVELGLRPGEAAWISGRNGVGKTTLLRVVAGLIRPDEGTVHLAGFDPRRDRRAYADRIGFLSAGDRGLYARLTVTENLQYATRIAMVPRRGRSAAIDRVTRLFELDELLPRRADRISMGQRQRVRLAMTFLHDPLLLLLDEPRNSLDDEGLALVVAAVQDRLDRGGMTIWCSPKGEPPPFRLAHELVIADGTLVRA